MKKMIVVGLVVFSVAVAVTPRLLDDAHAGGTAVFVSPDAGESATVARVSGVDWLADVEVRIFAGFVSDIDQPNGITWFGPLAVVQSDADGTWEAEVPAASALGLELAEEPGFVVFRAESDDLPTYLELANEASFVLTVGGRRPAGAGEIRVHLSQADELEEELGFLALRQAGSTSFINHVGARDLPTEVVFGRLPDGHYEVTAETLSGMQPVGEGLMEVSGAVCTEPDCEGPLRSFKIQSVSIRNGSVEEVRFFFGAVGELPNGGLGSHRTSGGLLWPKVATIGIASFGALLAFTGWLKRKPEAL